jgi:hypothetical protein
MLHHIKKQNKTRGTNLKNTKIRKKKKKIQYFPLAGVVATGTTKAICPPPLLKPYHQSALKLPLPLPRQGWAGPITAPSAGMPAVQPFRADAVAHPSHGNLAAGLMWLSSPVAHVSLLNWAFGEPSEKKKSLLRNSARAWPKFNKVRRWGKR